MNMYSPSARSFWLILMLLASMTIGLFLFAQYIGELLPCTLCYWQRYPWYGLFVVSCVAIFVPYLRSMLWFGGISLLFITGGIGVFHAGVEYGFWQGLSTCESNLAITDNIEELRAILLARQSIACDEAPWSLLHVSMAGYNAIFSFSLGLMMLYVWFLEQKIRNKQGKTWK